MTTNKLPPHNPEAEEAVVGSLLIGGEIGDASHLVPDDFYTERNSFVFAACKSLSERSVSINQITAAEELDRMGKLEAVGGAAYLSHLIAECPTSMDLVYYAEIVQRTSVSRRLISAAGKIAEIGYRADPNLPKSLDKADEALLEVRKHGVPSPIVTPKDRALRMSDRYDELSARDRGVVISTGLIDLDYRLGGGFYDGDFILLGSRPSVGKTSLLQFLAKNIAEDRKVLFCSGEMSIESISDRDVAALTGVHISTIRLGNYPEDLHAKIADAWGQLSQREIYYYEDMPLTVAKVAQAANTMQLRYGLGVIIVDYIGMLDDEYGQGEYERISFISRRLKQLARKFNVPLIAAHQLNRALEAREDKRPQLYDLRGSGKLEEDADDVLFLYRDDYYYTAEEWADRYPDKKYPEGIVEILIAKQRQGEANRLVKVLYEPTHQAYLNLKKEGAL